jgi:hypothetical protein
METEYKVLKPFNLIDIYNESPCSGEYAALMVERADEGFRIRQPFKTFKDIEDSEVLMRNLSWLKTHGFISEGKFKSLDFNKPILAYGGSEKEYLLMPMVGKLYKVVGYNWFRLGDFEFNSCCTFKTIESALQSYGERKFKNVDLFTKDLEI